MGLLKESIESITYQDKYENVYEDILSKINKLGIVVEKHDKHNGIIIVRWIAKIVNMLFWQCYSDKLLLEIKEVDKNRTRVDISAIPNLFRIKVKKGEKASDPHELISYLQGLRKIS
jgi:hypothetical protein